MDPLDPSQWGVGSDTYGFTLGASSVGPQTDGTNIVPATGMAITGADQAGYGANYAPAVFALLNNGLSAFTSLYGQNQQLNYQRYEATQAGLVAQGNAVASTASAQISAVNSNKMLLILGMFAVIALAIHKG
jgi:hypothetical protein